VGFFGFFFCCLCFFVVFFFLLVCGVGVGGFFVWGGGGGVGVFLLLYVPGSFSTYCMPNFCRMELSGMVWDLGWQ